MGVMYLLIAFSLVIASGFLVAFIWAVRSGQYDDRDTPSIRMLIDDVIPHKKKRNNKQKERPEKDAGEEAAENDAGEETEFKKSDFE